MLIVLIVKEWPGFQGHVDRQNVSNVKKKMSFVDRVDRVAYVVRVDRQRWPEFLFMLIVKIC